MHATCYRLKIVNSNPQFDGWIFPIVKANSDDIDKSYPQVPENSQPWHTDMTKLEDFFRLQSPWQTSSPIWSKKFLFQNNIKFDEKLKLWQDVDFHIQILLNRPKLFFAQNQKPDILYRIHNQTISQRQYTPQHRISQIYFFDKNINLLKQHKSLSDKYLQLLNESFKQTFNKILTLRARRLKIQLALSKFRILKPYHRLQLIKSALFQH